MGLLIIWIDMLCIANDSWYGYSIINIRIKYKKRISVLCFIARFEKQLKLCYIFSNSDSLMTIYFLNIKLNC